MDLFYKKVDSEFDADQLGKLASKLADSQVKRSWLGRKIVVGKEDLTPRIKAALKGIQINLGSLEGESREHVISLLTKLDNLYNIAGKVGWFNPTGKAAKALKIKIEDRVKLELLSLCEEKCLNISNESTAEDRPKKLIEILKKMLNCNSSGQRFELKKQVIQLVYGPINRELLHDKAFVEKMWGEIRGNLCIQQHLFFKSLRKGPEVIALTKNDEAKRVYTQIAKRSRNQTPKKMKLEQGMEVQIPGDFEDSIRRNVFKQIDKMKDFYNELDPSVKEKVPQASIAEFSREELSHLFLLDLRAKLGRNRECLMESLLLSIEQACDNYAFEEVSSQMNKEFGGEIYQTLENPIRHLVSIKIPKDENRSVEALIESDYPMRILDLGDKSGIIRKFTPMEVKSTLTLKFKVPEGFPVSPSDCCEEVSLVVMESKVPIDENQYLIVSV